MTLHVKETKLADIEWNKNHTLYYATLNHINKDEVKELSGDNLEDVSIQKLIKHIVKEEQEKITSAQLYSMDGLPITNDPKLNNLTLKQRNIKFGSLIFVVFHQERATTYRNIGTLDKKNGEQSLSVHVPTLEKIFSVTVDLDNNSIKDLKLKIKEETHIETSCQQLSINGEDDEKLNNELHNGDTVLVSIASEYGEIYASKSENFKADVKPNIQQTENGLALFYSSLFVLAEHVEDYDNVSVECVLATIREMTGFPPLVASLAHLFYGQSITYSQKISIVEGLYHIFRELLSSEKDVKDNRVYEFSSLCWSYIMNAAKNTHKHLEEEENYDYIDLTCPMSGKRLFDPVRIDGNSDGQYERVLVEKRIQEEEPIDGIIVKKGSWKPADDIKRLLLCVPYSQDFCFVWQIPKDYRPMKKKITPIAISEYESQMLNEEEHLKICPPLLLKKPDTHEILPCLTIHPTKKYVVVCTGVVKESVPTSVYLFNPMDNTEAKHEPDQMMLQLMKHNFSEIKTEATGQKNTYTLTPKEAIVVLFDISGSMDGNCLDGKISKLDAIKQLFHAFADRTMSYNFSHVVGLTTFESSVHVVAECTEAFEWFKQKIDVLKTAGATALYDAIDNGVSQLNKISKQYPDCKKRLLCMTDGCEYRSKINDICIIGRKLKESNVYLDSVLVGTENDALKCLSIISGGSCFHPATLGEGVQLFESETLLSLEMRKKVDRKNHEIRSKNDILQYKDTPYADVKVLDHRQKTIERTLPDHVVLNIAADSPPKDGKTKEIFREKRILREISSYHKKPHANIFIYPEEKNYGLWHVVLKGPCDTPYEGGVFSLYVQFPNNYPASPPEVRFTTPIYHCNINKTGRVCHSILDREYTSRVSVSTILLAVYGLLVTPEPSDPLDSVIAETYFSDRNNYLDLAKKETKRHADKPLSDHLTTISLAAKSAADPDPSLVCPLTKAVYVDPVKTPDGKVYERYAIEESIKEKKEIAKDLERSELQIDWDKMKEVDKYRQEQIKGNKWWQS